MERGNVWGGGGGGTQIKPLFSHIPLSRLPTVGSCGYGLALIFSLPALSSDTSWPLVSPLRAVSSSTSTASSFLSFSLSLNTLFTLFFRQYEFLACLATTILLVSRDTTRFYPSASVPFNANHQFITHHYQTTMLQYPLKALLFVKANFFSFLHY